ncbi:hypothetical protein [Histidinibacterium lentulum]|nr:hypothetical protein [Histidinibacterium lentulum]
MGLARRLCIVFLCLSLLPWGAAVRAGAGAEGLPPPIAAALSGVGAGPDVTVAVAPDEPVRQALPARLCFGPSLTGPTCGSGALPPEAPLEGQRRSCREIRTVLADPHLPEGIVPDRPQRPPRAA